ncbi:helix-turn-helix domain-containing protein [Halolamina pelagica]|uniref:helix-turn-helix domain-containing protein n=1 Tax=Halolamina pelagica TaxID=699431 RepID=UPI000B3160FF|nr:helix-turn-helix domain-containing protein [Halolamina pelagica]
MTGYLRDTTRGTEETTMTTDPLATETPTLQTVFDALEDQDCRAILEQLDRPMAAKELCEACEIPNRPRTGSWTSSVTPRWSRSAPRSGRTAATPRATSPTSTRSTSR